MTVADGLQFDQAQHQYTLDGRRLPSVTEVLAPITAHEYRGVDRETMDRAALLGKAVHKLIELDIVRTLDEDALDDALRPYLAQWRQFRDQSGFHAHFSEERMYSSKYGYAGTMDLFGTLNRKFTLIDLKRTASVPRTAGPQTAAYVQMIRENSFDLPANIDRFALHLTPERWRLVPFNDPNDLRVFLAALTLHNYLEQSK